MNFDVKPHEGVHHHGCSSLCGFFFRVDVIRDVFQSGSGIKDQCTVVTRGGLHSD